MSASICQLASTPPGSFLLNQRHGDGHVWSCLHVHARPGSLERHESDRNWNAFQKSWVAQHSRGEKYTENWRVVLVKPACGQFRKDALLLPIWCPVTLFSDGRLAIRHSLWPMAIYRRTPKDALARRVRLRERSQRNTVMDYPECDNKAGVTEPRIHRRAFS